VLANINKVLRTNGTALLLTPANGYLGHGFYQFSPEFFYSALTPENGFSETIVVLIDRDRPENWYCVKSPTALQDRNQAPNKRYQLLCYTRKIATVDSISAQQSYYKNLLWKQRDFKYVMPQPDKSQYQTQHKIVYCSTKSNSTPRPVGYLSSREILQRTL
jgi:hypothetical protein